MNTAKVFIWDKSWKYLSRLLPNRQQIVAKLDIQYGSSQGTVTAFSLLRDLSLKRFWLTNFWAQKKLSSLIFSPAAWRKSLSHSFILWDTSYSLFSKKCLGLRTVVSWLTVAYLSLCLAFCLPLPQQCGKDKVRFMTSVMDGSFASHFRCTLRRPIVEIHIISSAS